MINGLRGAFEGIREGLKSEIDFYRYRNTKRIEGENSDINIKLYRK